jgi:hypothetical protein
MTPSFVPLFLLPAVARTNGAEALFLVCATRGWVTDRRSERNIDKRGTKHMALILLVLLLALLLGGLGFAVHVLWWIALIVLVVWVLGFLIRVGEGGSRGRWYRW